MFHVLMDNTLMDWIPIYLIYMTRLTKAGNIPLKEMLQNAVQTGIFSRYPSDSQEIYHVPD